MIQITIPGCNVPTKKFLFLLAHLAGSAGACGEDTGVRSAEDLLPEYKAGNENIFALEIETYTSEIAAAVGLSRAFEEEYLANDIVHNCAEDEIA